MVQYFEKLAAWGAKTKSDNDRLVAELQETKQALKEATALIDKVRHISELSCVH